MHNTAQGGAPATLASITVGALVTGVVQEVKGGCVWVELSAALKGRVSALDSSASLDVIQALNKNFPGGSRVSCRVLSLDVPAGRLDLSMRMEAVGAISPPVAPTLYVSLSHSRMHTLKHTLTLSLSHTHTLTHTHTHSPAGSATPGDKKKRKSAAGGVAADDIVPGAKVHLMLL